MYFLLRSMGFNPNVIKDKNLRKEFYAIVSIMLDNYQLYGKPYDKTIFMPAESLSKEEQELQFLINLADKRYYCKEVVDSSKSCKSMPCFQLKTKLEYNFDATYDNEDNTYTFSCYPLTRHQFSHNEFAESFSIIYDADYETLIASKYYKGLDGKLIKELHTYMHEEGTKDIILLSTYNIFSPTNIELLEHDCMQRLQLNLNQIYQPGEPIFLAHLYLEDGKVAFSTNSAEPIRKFVPTSDNNMSMLIAQNNLSTVFGYRQNGTIKNAKQYSFNRNIRSLISMEFMAMENYKQALYYHNKNKGKKMNKTC